MRRLAALLIAAALTSGFVTACGDDDDEPSGAASEEKEAVDLSGDPYDVPATLPDGEPGDLIRVEELDPVAGVNGTVYRVLYLSESQAGEPIAVTGLVAAPEGKAPTGGWPVVSFGHGTAGIADTCAPSKVPELAYASVAPLLDEGMVVAISDYEGLGTPGRHPYIAGVSEGRGILDIARAAGRMEDVAASDQVVLWGHSQGAHGVLFANQIAQAWAPELDVLGTVSIAPATELPIIVAALKESPVRGYLAMAALGLGAAYPDADPALVLAPPALALAKVIDEGCLDDIVKAFVELAPADLIANDPGAVEPWKSIMLENDPGHVKGASPILIVHGDADKTIPVIASQLLRDRLCGLGQNVVRTVYPGATHSDVVAKAFSEMVAFTKARFASTPATTGCGS